MCRGTMWAWTMCISLLRLQIVDFCFIFLLSFLILYKMLPQTFKSIVVKILHNYDLHWIMAFKIMTFKRRHRSILHAEFIFLTLVFLKRVFFAAYNISNKLLLACLIPELLHQFFNLIQFTTSIGFHWCFYRLAWWKMHRNDGLNLHLSSSIYIRLGYYLSRWNCVVI